MDHIILFYDAVEISKRPIDDPNRLALIKINLGLRSLAIIDLF